MHAAKLFCFNPVHAPRLLRAAFALSLAVAAWVLAPGPAAAKPLYASQLGLACGTCHQPGREAEGANGLNAYGQAFLQNGRVLPAAPAYGQPAPAYGQPAPAYGQPAPVYGQPAPAYGQPAPAYGQPAPAYGQPAPAYQQPAPMYQQAGSAGLTSSAISWYDSKAHLAVYTASGGVVTERGWEEGSQPWTGRTFPGTSVGATTWADGQGRHIRVFVSNNGQITEYAFDRVSWTIGPLSVPGRNPAVTSWTDSSNKLHHRLYVERNDGRLTEYTWDQDIGRWMGGQ